MKDTKSAIPKLQEAEEPDQGAPEERLGSPEALIAMHDTFASNDGPGSENRGAVQELMDFVPPFNQTEMEDQGRPDGFNVNFGLGASIKNEALGVFVDIFSTPSRLMNIPIGDSIDDPDKSVWEEILGEELTKMIRAADIGISRFLSLADIFTTHGVAIAYFEDTRNWRFNVTGLDEMKFPKDTESIGSMVEVMTSERYMTLDKLYREIEHAPEGAEYHNGWNVEEVKKAIRFHAKVGQNRTDKYPNYEAFVREAKTNQLYVANCLSAVLIVYGWVREYDGKFSCYATVRTTGKDSNRARRAGPKEEELGRNWVFKQLSHFDAADQFFQIFSYSVGHKNQVYTQRGLGYFIYEAAQADNVLRNKMMENARMASSHVYSAETLDDSIAFEVIDYGPIVVLPPGLVSKDQPAAMNLERNMMPALEANEGMLERHSGGLASSNYFKEPRARENRMATAAFLESTAKLNAFAINLWYNPWDKLMREMTRRAFSVVQTDAVAKKEVQELKDKCMARGVPVDVFESIAFEEVTAVRVLGNGSRQSRLMIFEATSQMYPDMDPEGQQNFTYDFLTEYFGAAQVERYKMRPSKRTQPLEEKIAELENFILLDGGLVEIKSGEMTLVHLAEHLDEIEAGMELVTNGQMSYGEWTKTRIQLYTHIEETLQQATTNETMIPQLNEFRRRTQNIKEIIENGIKELEAEAEGAEQQQQGEGGQPSEEQDQKEQEHAAEIRRKFELLQADIAGKKELAAANIAIKKAEAMADIGRKNMLAANDANLKRTLS